MRKPVETRRGIPSFSPCGLFYFSGGSMANKRKAEKIARAKTELEQIDSAISAILSGAQSYSIGTRSLTRADLATLYKRKNTLDDLVDALSGGSGRFRRVIPLG
jgi:hypothetical protein